MSADSITGLADLPTSTERRPSLLRAEVRRFRSRRFVRVMLLLAVVGYVVAVVIMASQYAKPSPEGLVEARQRVEQLVVEQNQFRAECLTTVPADASPDDYCGPVATVANFGDLSNFLPRQAFVLKDIGPDAATGFGVGVAALFFLIGATWIGAEWSSKNLASWLTWEPRRLRVMAAKVTVLGVAAAIVAAMAQLAWLGTAWFLASTRGIADVPVDFWGELWALQGRLVVFAVLAAVGGFALANLTHNTGAALGIAFLYVAVLETAVRALEPSWQRFLLSDNALGFLQPRGLTIQWYDEESFMDRPHEVFISHWGGGLTVGVAVLVVLAVGVALFHRRDIT